MGSGNELISIKAVTPRGEIADFTVRQILEIDGKPFIDSAQLESSNAAELRTLRDELASTIGRVTTIEKAIFREG